jgi:hypothetical protein
LLERIARAGGKLLYDPAAVVGHRVAPSRLRRCWFWSRSYWGSRGSARMLPVAQVSPYTFLRAAWHVSLATWRALGALSSHDPRSEDVFHRTMVLASRLGYLVGLAERLPSHFCPPPGEHCRTVGDPS